MANATGSVVICAYTLDRWTELKAAVRSVLNQTIPAKEVFVVIDHNDALYERADREISGGIVRVVANQWEPGLVGGRMTGAELARGSVIVFLDDDAVAEPDWLEKLLRPYDDPCVLGVGGNIIPLWQGRKPHWFPPEFYWVIGCIYIGMPVGPGSEVRNMIGANMSVRADVLRQIGGFTTSLGRRESG